MPRALRIYMCKTPRGTPRDATGGLGPGPGKPRRPAWWLGLACALALGGGCSSVTVDPWPEPLSPASAPESEEPEARQGRGDERQGVREDARPGPTITPTPGVTIQSTVVDATLDRLGADLQGPSIDTSFNDIPLPNFINEVFGELLGMEYSVDQSLQGAPDLVNLRLTTPRTPSELFAIARDTLADYNVAITRAATGILTFRRDDTIASGDLPLLVTGRTLPEVPASHRIVFQYVPLHIVSQSTLNPLLQQIFLNAAPDLISPEGGSRGLLLKGTPDQVESALSIIKALDQPLLRGKNGAIIEPVFLKVDALAADLTEVLGAEGYAVGDRDGILLLPLASARKLIAFANSPDVLDHVKRWADILDSRRQESQEQAWFDYRVRYRKAEDFAETLNSVLATLGDTTIAIGDDPAAPPPLATQAQPAPAGQAPAPDGEEAEPPGALVVDKEGNTLLFRGSYREWAQLRQIIDKLDRPIPQVLIEVLIAEVALSNKEESGLEFVAKAALDSRYGVVGGTLGALGLKGTGLSLTLNSAGATRAALNMFQDESRVVIRSRPSLMVRSGETANIESGNEIPTVTQAADAGTQLGGSTNVLQQVEYRQTGVNLQIDAVVLADGLVDLEITQTLSEARPTAATSLAGSPTILNRSLTTSVSLKNGSSLVLGGLIANSKSGGQGGVPLASRVPVLGRLFRTDTFAQDRTELVILVVPYVVADHSEGQALADALRARLSLHGVRDGG